MSTRILLKKSADESMTKTEKRKWDKDVYLLEGVEAVADETTGEKYIVIHADPLDPAASMPRVARKYIKRVTYTEEKYFEGFRTDGVYKLRGATARVDTIEVVHAPGWQNVNDTTTISRHQTISISAGSIRTLREIYTKVRQGTLKPVEDWGAHLSEVEHRERRAAFVAEVEAAAT